MFRRLALLPLLTLAPGLWIPAGAQSVISTHSGMVYFFDGSVYLADQRLEQRFGRFPDIGEGRELRTDQGRAEVLLTPGVVLRVGDHSAIRMLSTAFSDTRVELLAGSAIVEANEPASRTNPSLIYKTWQVRMPQEGVYRIDSQPAQVIVYKGKSEVSAEGDPGSVEVGPGQTLPLAAVLVPEQQSPGSADDFKNWAMNRSQAVSSDNATAAGIVDDPSAIENSAGVFGGLDGLGSLSYFPLTGIPGIAITNPYGLSFWSPFQSTLNAMYLPLYGYGLFYSTGWPSITRPRLWHLPGTVTRLPSGFGLHPGGLTPARTLYTPYTPLRPTLPSMPHTTAPHVAPHAVGHR
ncbi:MAG TPA: hypothetical protein VMH81_29300 [Bryobacteraceae bacterium]|nr:hypothetical protein [Bryobacteraceae bacterium]